MGGLLLLAFAYLAVGQAAANRNGAQTAADAAALAAAQDTRDELAGEWVQNVLDPTKWQDIFNGKDALFDGCDRANQLAAQNEAAVKRCGRADQWPLGYTVDVETTKPVGDSIIPGTEGKYSKATATAEIESLCSFDPTGDDAGHDVLPQLTCKGGKTWNLDPHNVDDPEDLPGPEDLFDVHLAD